jgi:hypothetical protein
VTLPPITRWRVESRLADGTLVDVIAAHVNFEADLAALLADLQAERDEDTRGAIVGIVTVLGRRRMNDHVGSPIWSDWEAARLPPAALPRLPHHAGPAARPAGRRVRGLPRSAERHPHHRS